MKSGRTQVEIIALYEELGSYRAVGALLSCDHKTVKRYKCMRPVRPGSSHPHSSALG